MLLLGTMQVEERIAAFLLNLSERYRERGYSSTEFVLRAPPELFVAHVPFRTTRIGGKLRAQDRTSARLRRARKKFRLL